MLGSWHLALTQTMQWNYENVRFLTGGPLTSNFLIPASGALKLAEMARY